MKSWSWLTLIAIRAVPAVHETVLDLGQSRKDLSLFKLFILPILVQQFEGNTMTMHFCALHTIKVNISLVTDRSQAWGWMIFILHIAPIRFEFCFYKFWISFYEIVSIPPCVLPGLNITRMNWQALFLICHLPPTISLNKSQTWSWSEITKTRSDRTPAYTFDVATTPSNALSGRASVRQPDETESSLTDTPQFSFVWMLSVLSVYAEDGAIPPKTPIAARWSFRGLQK